MPKLTRVKARKAIAPKPKRATLHTRKRCYAGHPMSGANVDRYAGSPKWIGCRKCRAGARLRWHERNALKIAAAIVAQRKADKEALNAAIPPKAKTPPKPRKANKPRKVTARKANKPRKVTARKAKLSGQARIDAELKAFGAKRGKAA